MENSPWILTGISATAPMFVGVWTFIQWYAGRKDKAIDRELSEEQRRENDLDRERHEIMESHSQLLAQLRTDVDRYRKIIEEKNIERWYAWDRARFWHQVAWDMRNEAAYARQIVESASRLAGDPPRIWERSLDMPPFDSKNQPSKQTD
jgi:hypothetical protein